MSNPIPVSAFQDALVLLDLDDRTVSEREVKAKRTAAAKSTHPDLFLADVDKESANDRLARINEACDLLLECLELGILPRFRYPKSLNDFDWQTGAEDETAIGRSTSSRRASKRTTKKPPAWVLEEYKLFTDWCSTIEYLTVARMDKEWKRRLAARRFEEDMRTRREAEAAERLRQEILAEEALAEDERKRAAAEAMRLEKRLRKQAEAAERKRQRVS